MAGARLGGEWPQTCETNERPWLSFGGEADVISFAKQHFFLLKTPDPRKR